MNRLGYMRYLVLNLDLTWVDTPYNLSGIYCANRVRFTFKNDINLFKIQMESKTDKYIFYVGTL